jgi:hypothetical protein
MTRLTTPLRVDPGSMEVSVPQSVGYVCHNWRAVLSTAES